MITQDKLDRINQLAKKKKEEGLTAEESAEQKVLYQEYIKAFRENLKAQLEMIEIVDEDQKEVEEIEKEVEALEETLEKSKLNKKTQKIIAFLYILAKKI